MGGCLLTDNFNWGAQMLAYQSRPPDPALRDDWRERWAERIETLPFLAARWLEHPVRDAYWRHGSVCEDWQAIEAAVLAIGGWADAYVNAPPALAANLTANPLEAVTTVTAQIVTLLVGDQEFDSPKTLAAFALGLVLFLITLALNVIALHVVRRYREQYE